MEIMAAIEIALTVINTIQKTAPIVSKFISDMTPIGEAVVQKLTGEPMTDDQRLRLREAIIAAHNEFQALTPPPGEA